MRLRPFGDSGPLVLSFAALEDYYQEQGRDWERYAMVKARGSWVTATMPGQRAARHAAPVCVPPLHRLQRDPVPAKYERDDCPRGARRRGLKDNIKLGAGGIREIEFIVQISAADTRRVNLLWQSRSLLPTLSAIEQLHLLPEGDAQTLRDSYLFLRRLENLLQSINDEQTQTLPGRRAELGRVWPGGCGWMYQSGADATAGSAYGSVRRIFNDLIGDDESESQDDALSDTGASCGRTRSRKMTSRRCWRTLSDDACHRVVADC